MNRAIELKNYTDAVTASKKYASLYPPLIERICAEEMQKYKSEREVVKSVKNKLHLLYGAYLEETNLKKTQAAQTLVDARDAEAIMRLHASTRERLPYLTTLYEFIFGVTGTVRILMDIGCGYNPFSLPWMPHESFETYYACDIDVPASALINRWLSLNGLPEAAFCADIAAQTPMQAVDLALVFKLLPVLDGQQKGRGFALLSQLNAKHIAVTYPLKTLCGKEKGMGAHYARQLEDGLTHAPLLTVAARAEIGNELVFVLKNARDGRNL